MWEPQGVRGWRLRARRLCWAIVSEELSLEVKNKLKTTVLSFSGRVDPFSLRVKATGNCGAERLSWRKSDRPVISIGK